jgi:hypothetical protein
VNLEQMLGLAAKVRNEALIARLQRVALGSTELRYLGTVGALAVFVRNKSDSGRQYLAVDEGHAVRALDTTFEASRRITPVQGLIALAWAELCGVQNQALVR